LDQILVRESLLCHLKSCISLLILLYCF
jgi:hypothetical protein